MDVFAEFDALFDRWLGLEGCNIGVDPQYQHPTTLNRLSELPYRNRNFNLVEEMLSIIEDVVAENEGNPGAINFQFRSVPGIAAANDSPEVTLERAIVLAANGNQEPHDRGIGNMMPVASGVFQPRANTRNAVDLVEMAECDCSLIELKVAANTPLSAAFQILSYGMCYAFARAYPARFGCHEDLPVFRVEKVRLEVLAPDVYFRQTWIGWLLALSEEFNRMLQNADIPFRYDNPSYALSFEFKQFLEGFQWEAAHVNDTERREHALKAFVNREALRQD